MFGLITVPLTVYRLAQLRGAGSGERTAWQLGGQIVGVIGHDRIINAMIRAGATLASGAARLDAEAAREIVDLAQARVPRRTGLLHDGISAVQDGDAWVVSATARKFSHTKDYAKDVEFGTKPGQRARRVADDDYFAGPYAGRRGSLNAATGRRRRAHDARRLAARTHSGTAAQPYFLNSIAEVMERRGVKMQTLADDAAAEAGL